jgi:hypothetical protein
MAIGFDALNVGATICDNGHLRKQDFGKLENAKEVIFYIQISPNSSKISQNNSKNPLRFQML